MAHHHAHLAQTRSQSNGPSGRACQIESALQPLQPGIMVVQHDIGIAAIDGSNHSTHDLTRVMCIFEGLCQMPQSRPEVARVVFDRCQHGAYTGAHAGVERLGVCLKSVAPNGHPLIDVREDGVACLLGFEVMQSEWVFTLFGKLHRRLQGKVTLTHIPAAGIDGSQNALGVGATDSVTQCFKPGQGLHSNANRFVKPGQQPLGFTAHQQQPGLELRMVEFIGLESRQRHVCCLGVRRCFQVVALTQVPGQSDLG